MSRRFSRSVAAPSARGAGSSGADSRDPVANAGGVVVARVRAPYVERLRERVATLDRAARRIVEICAQLGDVRAVYAFGSYAAGTVRPHSDLDVLVVRDTPLRRADRDLAIRLAFDVSVGLDCLVVTPEEFARDLPRTSFGRTILAGMKRLDAAG